MRKFAELKKEVNAFVNGSYLREIHILLDTSTDETEFGYVELVVKSDGSSDKEYIDVSNNEPFTIGEVRRLHATLERNYGASRVLPIELAN